MNGDGWWWAGFLVQCAIAIGTVGATLAALFGDRWKASKFPARLALQVVKEEGVAIPVHLRSPDGSMRTEDARFYNLRVWNTRTWPKATQTQVHLIRYEVYGPDKRLHVKWSGHVPLKWVHQELYALERTIGHHFADCDLLLAVKSKWIEIQPMIVPTSLTARWHEPIDMVLSFQARSNEGDSPILAVRVSWDGEWADGETEMSQHLVVKAQTEGARLELLQ